VRTRRELRAHGALLSLIGVRHERLDVADPKKFQREWQLQLLLHPLDPSHPFKTLRS